MGIAILFSIIGILCGFSSCLLYIEKQKKEIKKNKTKQM